MAGKPVQRSRRLLNEAIEALSSGRTEQARLLLAEMRRTLTEAGLPVPALPPDVATLWVSVTETQAARDASPPKTTAMADKSRLHLIEAAELAAERLVELMRSDGLFGPEGIHSPERQISLITTALQRGYGSMPAGAQRVDPAALGDAFEAPNQQSISRTLTAMIRTNAEAKAQGKLVDAEILANEHRASRRA